MSRGITEQDVWEAADALLVNGERPTIERVRLHIGRGSPNTVSPLLDSWFKQLGKRLQDPKAFQAVPDLPEGVATAAEHFWRVALDLAHKENSRRFAAAQEELQAARAALQREQQHLQAEQASFEARKQGLTQAMELLQDQLEQARAELQSSRSEGQARSEALRALQAEFAQAQSRERALQDQLHQQRAAADAERSRLEERSVAQERRQALEIDRLREALKSLQADSERTVAHHRSAHQAAVAQHETLQREVERVRMDNSRLEGALQAEQQARENLAARTQRQQDQLDELMGQLRNKDVEHAELLRSVMAAIPASRGGRKESPKAVRK